jgi:hypothetical protein
VVWEFLNPTRGADGTRIAVVAGGARVDPATLTFLEAKGPIANAAPEPAPQSAAQPAPQPAQ